MGKFDFQLRDTLVLSRGTWKMFQFEKVYSTDALFFDAIMCK